MAGLHAAVCVKEEGTSVLGEGQEPGHESFGAASRTEIAPQANSRRQLAVLSDITKTVVRGENERERERENITSFKHRIYIF